MKRLILIAAIATGMAHGQVATIPNTAFPAVRALMNSNFTFLAANKLQWQGAWSISTTYAQSDVVSNGGNTWVSLAAGNVGHTPAIGLYWQQLGSAGAVTTVFGRTGAVTGQSSDYAGIYLTANQSITWTAAGDASGTASGATSITPSLTITGLKGAVLPSLATGNLRYNGSAWTFDATAYQAAITTGTQDQVLVGTLALKTLVDCLSAGGVYQYSTASHAFACHTLTATDAAAAGTLTNNTSGNAGTATALASVPTGCTTGYATGVAANGNASCTNLARAIGYVFDGGGSVLTSGITKYFTVPYACTIVGWNMTVDTGTATIDVWKLATGTAIPTVTNTITASAVPAISTGTAKHSTTLTAWTTAVTANDIFAFNLSAVASATNASLVLECRQ